MRLWLFVVCGAALLACPAPVSTGAGVDAGSEDSGVDAGFDAGVDAGDVDAGDPDAGEPDAGPPVEICDDWLDNDLDGGADCADLACAAEPLCLEDAGTCTTCGQTCVTQSACVPNSDYHATKPLPLCTHSLCTSRDEYLRVKVVVGTGNAWSVPPPVNSGVSRFIKKIALDGTAVTCATLEDFTAINSAANAIETSGRFNVQGFDIQGVMNFPGPGVVNFLNVNTQTGDDYLVWVELWSGQVDGTAWFPKGTRSGHGCLEDPGGALVIGDSCDTGTCRAFSISIPAPD